jgi:hypothetical protein
VKDSAKLQGGPLSGDLRTSNPSVAKRRTETGENNPGKTSGGTHPHGYDRNICSADLKIHQTLQVIVIA